MRLENQVALVTGSATGIGRATALMLAKEGAAVVVNYTTSEAEARETAQAIEAMGRRALLVRADVSDEAQVKRMVDETAAGFGRMDILVNNAGSTSFVEFRDLDGITEEIWDRTLAVNVKGLFFCSRAAGKVMKAQGKGCIVNVASYSGIVPFGSSIAYCAAKAAAISLTKTLAVALAPEIRVNAVAPSFTDTRWHSARPGYEEKKERSARASLMRRVGTAEDVAGVILALATDCSYVNGQTVEVHGGQRG